MDETGMISAREMAALLNVSRTSALRVANNPASNIRSYQEGRLRFYNRSDVEAFAAARQEGRQGLMTENETGLDDTPMSSAEDFAERADAVELIGVPTIMGSPKSLEDEAVLDNPESLSGNVDAGGTANDSQSEANQAAPSSTTAISPPTDAMSSDGQVDTTEATLDDDILTSLDLMENDDSVMESELVLDDALDEGDEQDLAEAAMLDDAPSGGGDSDLVTLVREQQQQLIAAERRVSELETELRARLSTEEERALRDEVAVYKALVDANTSAKKAKKDKKDKKDKKAKKDGSDD